MTTALTRLSLFQLRSTWAISARIGVSQALSFHGLLSVTVAMPPVTSVRTARSLLFDMEGALAWDGGLNAKVRGAGAHCQRCQAWDRPRPPGKGACSRRRWS